MNDTDKIAAKIIDLVSKKLRGQIEELAKVSIVAIEYDVWRLSSDPPKPEDFEPTGWIDVIYEDEEPDQVNQNGWDLLSRIGTRLKYGEVNYSKPTHWRKFTLPK